MHLGREVTTLYDDYTDQPVWKFDGVVIDELHKVESVFEVNIVVYNLRAESAQLVRRYMDKHDNTMYVNLYESHFSYIQDMKSYSHSYTCSKCEDSLWNSHSRLVKHELTCETGVRHVYNGGVYHTTPSIFQRLEDEGITVPEALRFYPFRATLTFECFFDGENLPADSDRVQWIGRHVPICVSLASTVPGYETPSCYVTGGDSDKLVADMITGLVSTRDAVYDLLKPSYESILDQLKARKEAWDDVESEANAEEEENEKESKNIPFNTLAGQLHCWLRQLPVIGFNSGKYDLNVIKRVYVPYIMKPSEDDEVDETRFVIKI